MPGIIRKGAEAPFPTHLSIPRKEPRGSYQQAGTFSLESIGQKRAKHEDKRKRTQLYFEEKRWRKLRRITGTNDAESEALILNSDIFA